MKKKWYLSTPVIVILFSAWLFIVPPILGIVLAILRFKQERENKKAYSDALQEVQKMQDFNNSIGFSRYEDVTNEIARMTTEFETQKSSLQQEISDLTKKRDEKLQMLLTETKAERDSILRAATDEKAQVDAELSALNSRLAELNEMIANNNTEISNQLHRLEDLQQNQQKLDKQILSQENKLRRIKELYKSIDYCVSNFFEYIPQSEYAKLPEEMLEEAETLAPTVISKLHCMNIKELQKSYRENDKQIDELLRRYSGRYTTKANIAIYNLMVIALRSELQNILTSLRYEKLDTAIDQVKEVSSKYLAIAGNGNQSIVGTLTKFIGEIEYLFINAVKIEYNYYVKKEQARQEQLALREQMKQEAEERKALEAEKKKIEREESKYTSEISKLNEQLLSATNQETELLKARILELQSQLSDVVVKKQEIATLANGKAGNVYIISNLGSFGENVFKIGMTRRLDPLDRINELGSASVPFKFDVHCFIFSNDAVSLENRLHSILNEKRVNKVNLRKEFFCTTVDELEELVYSIDPTAEFNKTMVAEEFRQSQSSEFVYSTSEDSEIDDEDDE